MSDQSRTTESKADNKAQHKVNPPVVNEQGGAADLAIAPLLPFQGGSLESQVAMLEKLPSVQRHAMIQRISQVQGHRHVQRVVAALQGGNGSRSKTTTTPAPGLQTSLEVGEPDDEYEQEADEVAKTVMRMSDASSPPPPDGDGDGGGSSLRSSTAPFEEIQASGAGAATVTPEVETRVNDLRGTGSPLPGPERAFFEDRFGTDFSGVRVHTSDAAVQTAEDLDARAYTVGSDIAFNAGEYRPGSEHGRELLAHELTHVVQQGGAGELSRARVQRLQVSVPSPEEMLKPPPGKEEEAEQMAARANGTEPQSQDQTPEGGNGTGASTVASVKEGQTEAGGNGTGTPASVAVGKGRVGAGGNGKDSQVPPTMAPAQPTSAGNDASPEASLTEDASSFEMQSASEKAPEELEDLSTQDLALIDQELVEHQSWAGAKDLVGEAGSSERANFVAEAVGSGALVGAGTGLAMGFGVGLLSQALNMIPVPGVGAILGGAMSAYGLATRDWQATGDTIAKFGQGSSGYEKIANTIASVSEVIDVGTQILGALAGVLGIISAAMWIITVITLGAASPLAFTLSAIAAGIGIGTAIADAINAGILQPCVMLFRSMHAFTSDADPREIEAQGADISISAQKSAAALGAWAGGAAASKVASKTFATDEIRGQIKSRFDEFETYYAKKHGMYKDFGEKLHQLKAQKERRLGQDPNKYKDYEGDMSKFDRDIEVYKQLFEDYGGVKIKSNGHPDFSSYSESTVQISMKGNRTSDFDAADAQALRTNQPTKAQMEQATGQSWTWHHHENGRTMELVPFELHNRLYHKGGVHNTNKGGTFSTKGGGTSSDLGNGGAWVDWRASYRAALNFMGIDQEQEEDALSDFLTVPINPQYSDPPGTSEQLDDIQVEILGLLESRALAEQAEMEATGHLEEHQENAAPIDQAVQEMTGALTATDAHEQAVARHEQANLEQQQRQQESESLIAGYPSRIAGITALTIPLGIFEGFTGWASKLPGDVGAAMLEVNKDAQDFMAALGLMDSEMTQQGEAQPAQLAALESDQARIEETEKQGEVTKENFEMANLGAEGLHQANVKEIEEAAALKDEAANEQSKIDGAVDEKEAEAQSLAAQLQAWAEDHQADREAAIEEAIMQLQEQEYEVVDEE